MHSHRLSFLCIGTAATIAMALCVTTHDSANAIPAFARKYSMSCTTCHSPVPRLKPYGDEFAGNGFVLKDKETPRYFVATGDDRLDLIRDLPLAIRFDGFLKHDTRTDRELDFTTPYNVKMLSGGTLTKNVAYYFYFFLSERGEVVGLEDAYLMFNDLFGRDLDLYVGQFQVSDPLFKREVRLTYEDYQIYRARPGDSRIGLTYDRGLMLIYGAPTGTDVVLEVLNGNGIGAADAARVYDDDEFKTVALRLSQDLAAQLRAGVFGYYGKEGMARHNEVWMAGMDATITLDKVTCNAQYLERRDDNPGFVSPKPDRVETRGGLVEVVAQPRGDRSHWYLTALYNHVESDDRELDSRAITGHVGHLLRTNIRLFFEGTYDIEDEESRFVLGTVLAF